MNTKPKLLLLHGALGSASSWSAHKAELEKYFELFVPDLPNHGDSAEQPLEPGLEWLTNWVGNYCNQHINGNFYFAGHSMGGYLGLNLAAMHQPGLLKTMTIGTVMNWDVDKANKEASRLNPEIMEQKIPAFCETLANLHGTDWRELVLQTADILLSIGHKPINTNDLNRILCPVAMARGTKDNMVTEDETTAAVEAIANGSYLVLENQPHQIENVDPSLLSEEMKRYFIG